MHHGTYHLTLKNPDGEIIHESTEFVEKNWQNCDFYNLGENLVSGGDFDDEILDESWKIQDGKFQIYWDGYIKAPRFSNF